ncbi:hypothetical protein GUJ93_ZPchr0007g5622 [Zizania palustris]|uniref:Argonaute linker 1 domain-containing protein n=1 Tax=Zizania palustris TaxID=103762 RepID=A0A8J5T9R6_ZIZPA|nr:hypothetical protein GUJ93_ZPchr0007g5622 [Zizania palustris]
MASNRRSRGCGGGGGGGKGGPGRGPGPSKSEPTIKPRPAGKPPLSQRYAPVMAAPRREFRALASSRGNSPFPARRAARVRRRGHGVPRRTRTSTGVSPAYDGRSNLFTAGELPFKRKKFEVDLSDRDDNAAGSSGNKEKKYNVVIRHAPLISLQDLGNAMSGYHADIPAQARQVLDIVLRDIVLTERNDKGYVAIGRSSFSPQLGTKDLGLGITAWKGFYQSCRLTQQGLSLNIGQIYHFVSDLYLMGYWNHYLQMF